MKKTFLIVFMTFLAAFITTACDFTTPTEEHNIEITANIDTFDYEINPGLTVEDGQIVTLSLLDHDTDYRFVHWSNSATDAVLSEAKSFSFIAEKDISIMAYFEAIPENRGALYLSSNLDTATLHPSDGATHAIGTEIEVAAEDPDDKYRFIHWIDENDVVIAKTASFTFEVQQKTHLRAIFDLALVHTLNLDSNLETAVFNIDSLTEHDDQSEIEISVSDPDNAHPFIHWVDGEGNIVSTEETFTLSINSYYNLTAVFDVARVPTHTVTLESNLEDAVFNVPTDGSFEEGESILVTASDPFEYYPFIHWVDDAGRVLSTDPAYTHVVSGDATLTAIFDLDFVATHTITLESNLASATFNMPLVSEHPEDELVAISVSAPDDTHTFLRWVDQEGRLIATSKTFIHTVNEDITLKAVFDMDAEATHTITLESNLEEAVFNLPAESVFEEGTTVEIIVSAPEERHPFLHWRDASGTILSTNATLNHTVIGDETLIAVFDLESGGDHAVNLTSNHPDAQLLISPDKFLYDDGESATITAPEVDGYRFEHWFDEDMGLALTTNTFHSIEVVRPMNLKAVYIAEGHYDLYLDANIEHADITRNQEGPYLTGDSLTLSAGAVEGYLFLHWYDYFNDMILSTEAAHTHVVDASRHIVAVYAVLGDIKTEYQTGFENDSKSSYAGAQINVDERPWFFEEALIGSLDNDKTFGESSVRIRNNGYIESLFSTGYLSGISFYHAYYGSDGAATVHVMISVDGETFMTIDSFTTAQAMTQYAYVFDDDFYDSHGLDINDPLYLRIAKSGGTRVNIDNLVIENRDIHIPPLPYEAVASGVRFPNNSERLVMDLSGLGRYYSYNEPWHFDGCLVTDTISGESVDCQIYGAVDTAALGEYDLVYYAMDADGLYVSETVTKVVLRDAALLEADYSELVDGYYSGIEGLYGEALRDALQDIITSGITYQSYGEARYILQESDADPDDPTRLIQIYLRNSVPGVWDGGETWNREHVWPSRRFPGDRESNLGSDLHNLAPADPGENSSRGYKYFSGATTSTTYEPHDDVKGDVARMMFYMDVFYDALTLVSGFADADNHEMGDLDYLISWHFTDTVSDFEINRNNVIHAYQNNRNPFIDIPGLIELIWFDHDSIPLD